MDAKSVQGTAAAFLAAILVFTSSPVGAFGLIGGDDGPERLDPAPQMDILRTVTTEVAPGEALVVNVDLKTHELTLSADPVDQIVMPTQDDDNTPNCLSTQRSSWVQKDEPLNVYGPPTGLPGLPGVLGECQWWRGHSGGIEQLTFILAERVGGSVDAIDEPTDSFIIVECERSGFAYGAPETEKDVQSITCEYRSDGDLPTNWTSWDSLMLLDGETPAGTGYGFGYAAFE